MSRISDLLEAIINGEDIDDFEPKTRTEAYLKACCEKCGCSGLPEPITKQGALLYRLAEVIAEGGDVTVEELTVTENGTYTAPTGKAYSPVEVNVPNPSTGNINITGTAQVDVTNYATAQVVDADLVAGNIKKNVDILGVVGTYEGSGGTVPTKGFVPTAWDSDGYVTEGTWYGSNVQEYALAQYNATYKHSCSYKLKDIDLSGVDSIGTKAFRSCASLELTELPSSVIKLGNNVFEKCTALTSMTFLRKPNEIGMLIFDGCTNLLHIYVPWGEDEMQYAPWGATNATIHYNYVPTE